MAEPEPVRAPAAGCLDAARECILAVGWRRTTLTDIARRAGVSRMTIYRRWPDTEAVLGDLLLREWSELLLDSGLLSDSGGSSRDQVARGVSAMVSAIRGNALFERIIEVDPELLQPYLFERRGRNQDWALELLEEYVVTGQVDGSVRDGKPDVLARTVLLASYGFVLSSRTMADSGVDTAALDAELLGLVERYLRP